VPDENEELKLAQLQLETVEAEARVKEPAYINDAGDIIVPFRGEEFRARKSVNFFAQAQFGKYTQLSTDDPRAMPALYDLLRGMISKEDWGRFADKAMDDDSEDQTELVEDLMDVANAVVEVIAGRPTKPRGGSSNTSRDTSHGSTGNSSKRPAARTARKK
jgi:hypothetical protein